MAGICTHYGDEVHVKLAQFVCDSEDEIKYLPTTTEKGTGIFANFNHLPAIGSVCQVGNEGGDLLIYQLYSFGWKKLS